MLWAATVIISDIYLALAVYYSRYYFFRWSLLLLLDAIVAKCFVARWIVRELVNSRKGELARAIATSIGLVNAPLTRTSGQTRKIYRPRRRLPHAGVFTAAGEFSHDFESSRDYAFSSANVSARDVLSFPFVSFHRSSPFRRDCLTPELPEFREWPISNFL